MVVLSRRALLFIATVALITGRASAQNAGALQSGSGPQQQQRGSRVPAEVINDSRAEAFDIGPVDGPWRIFVGRPRVPAPPEGYSVIFALDGNATFPLLWHAREKLAPDAPVMIVGIGYPTINRFDTERRFLDLTPFTPPESFGGRRSDRATGGREVFLDFIEREVLPEVAARVAIDPTRRTLFGHSLGGLFTLYTLYERSQLFSAYVAADPSIWWNKGSILAEEAQCRGALTVAGTGVSPSIRLLVENSGGERSDPSDKRGAPEFSARKAAERLAATGHFEVLYRVFPGETHPSMLAPALTDGLLFHLGTKAGRDADGPKPIVAGEDE